MSVQAHALTHGLLSIVSRYVRRVKLSNQKKKMSTSIDRKQMTWKSCGVGVMVALEIPLTDCTPRRPRCDNDAGVSIPDVTELTPEIE